MKTKRLSRQEIANLGFYDFLGYIGAFNSPYIGGMTGTVRLIELLNIRKDQNFRLLEIGCASGYTSCMIAKKFGCRVTGIDLSEILIAKAQERAEKLGLTNVEFRVADALDLPFKDDSFDAVFGVAITALVPDKRKALKEYIRVTKPGGFVGTLDLFLKSDAPIDIAEQFNAVLREVTGSNTSILTIDEWKTIFERTGLEEIQLLENCESVFEKPRNKIGTINPYLKVVYHIIVNKTIRSKFSKAMKLRKATSAKKREKYGYIGYLIFVGKKALTLHYKLLRETFPTNNKITA